MKVLDVMAVVRGQRRSFPLGRAMWNICVFWLVNYNFSCVVDSFWLSDSGEAIHYGKEPGHIKIGRTQHQDNNMPTANTQTKEEGFSFRGWWAPIAWHQVVHFRNLSRAVKKEQDEQNEHNPGNPFSRRSASLPNYFKNIFGKNIRKIKFNFIVHGLNNLHNSMVWLLQSSKYLEFIKCGFLEIFGEFLVIFKENKCHVTRPTNRKVPFKKCF